MFRNFLLNGINNFLKSHYGNKYENLHKYSEDKDIPSVEPAVGELLTFFISLMKPEYVLELGCGIGVSTNYILDGNVKHIDAVDANEIRIDKAKDIVNYPEKVTFHKCRAETFLSNCETKYDFVFVDTIKKDYLSTWYLLKDKLNENAVVIFDDVLLYGFVANKDSEVPFKYKNGVAELKIFLKTISEDKNLSFYIFPVGNGVLTVQI
jgi:predicted O-methyltransferase YrrM